MAQYIALYGRGEPIAAWPWFVRWPAEWVIPLKVWVTGFVKWLVTDAGFGADARVGLYMVMEHLPGEDLHSRLERERCLDVTTGVMVGHQIARGVSITRGSLRNSAR